MDQETKDRFLSWLQRQLAESREFLEAIEPGSVDVTCNGQDIKPEMMKKEREIIASLEKQINALEKCDDA